jgi:hypothetical protein
MAHFYGAPPMALLLGCYAMFGFSLLASIW